MNTKNELKDVLIIVVLLIALFITGIYIGASLQKDATLNRAKSYGETDVYTYEQVEFIILANN